MFSELRLVHRELKNHRFSMDSILFLDNIVHFHRFIIIEYCKRENVHFYLGHNFDLLLLQQTTKKSILYTTKRYKYY